MEAATSAVNATVENSSFFISEFLSVVVLPIRATPMMSRETAGL